MNEIKQTIFTLDENWNYYGACPICSKYTLLTSLGNNIFQPTKFICSHFRDVIIGQMGNVFGIFQELR